MPRVKKEETNKSGSLSQAIQAIKLHPVMTENEVKEEEIVDIIKFCEDPRFLDLRMDSPNGMELFPVQKIILKCYYIGTIGNEKLSLTQEEWEWLYKMEPDEDRDGEVYSKNIKDVIRKMLKRQNDKTMLYFSDLHLVLGRRSSKTFMASIITAYEAYKLLVINGGEPHKYLNLPADDEIAIINVALSEKQAGRLFGQIQSRIRNAPFFKGRIAKETTQEIRLYTNMDLRKKNSSDTNLNVNGSVLLLCGHSNPDSLAGYSAVLILFDEIAFFDENGKVTGTNFVGRLKPSLAKFYKYNNARMVFISSPNGRSGVFYDRWEDSKTDEKILSFQLPTWDVNPDVPYEHDELQRDRKSNIELFKKEFGSQWGESLSYHPFFDPVQIERCIRGDLQQQTRADPGINYYMHVDPAKKSHNYVAVMVGKERYETFQGHRRNRFFLAGIWIWRPQVGEGIQFTKIDQEMLQICRTFRPLSITYDDYHSMGSIELLRSHGFRTRITQFNRNMKWKIYQILRDAMCFQPQPELALYNNDPNSALLFMELMNIRTKQTQRGQTIVPDKSGEIKTDDVADCLAGAVAAAGEGLRAGLPEPVTVQMRW